MSLILVSPLSYLPGVLRAYAPSHLISLMSPDYMRLAPSDFPEDRHLRLSMHDIPEPADGMTPPDEGHVAALLGFARSWDATRPLVVHCWAGVSRSMAGAFAILCDRACRGEEKRLALEMRARAPHAAPNRRIVALADDLLNRHGAMMLAVEEMGPAVFVEEGLPVVFPLEELGL